MKVKVVLNDAEVREAIREWAESHGIPNAIVDTIKVRGTSSGNYNESQVDVLSAICEYEVDSFSTHKAREYEEVE